jgi:hypothetical protein
MSAGGESKTRLPELLQVEHFSSKSGRLQFWHQKSSLLPGENVFLVSCMDLNWVRIMVI